MFQPKAVKTNKKFVSVPQASFPKGYISTLSQSRIPTDGLAKMINAWLEQDSVPRPRPPFIPYGEDFLGTCIGIAPFVKNNAGVIEHWEISMQVIAVNEVQTLSITGSPTGGTFTLTYAGQTTGSIARNASASTVQTALIALSNIGPSDVVCTGGTLPGTPIVITFQGTLANTNVALITSTDSLSGGTSPASHIVQTTTGGPTSFVCTRKDGQAWSQVSSGAPVYDTAAWTDFTQGATVDSSGDEDDRVYVSNGVNNMSYYDIAGDAIVQYTGLSTPSAPTAVPTGLTGTNFTQYYRISANNAGGESAASASGNTPIEVARDFWTSGMSIAVSWSPVSGATSYNIYTADISGQEAYLATVAGTAFTDDGSVSINVFKLAPNSDSSAGPIVSTMINMDNQLYGCGDPNNKSFLWYSGQGQHFGDFSFNPQGGGYVGIDYGGDTLPTVPFAFHDGKGNPVLSMLTHGPVGRGKLYHLQFTTTTVGTTSVTFPNVYEASDQDGTPAPRGVAIYNNNAYYCTGTAMKTTGIKPNIINILSTDTISDQLLPDLATLNLGALDKMVAQEHLGKVYFSVATGSNATNNEIWILDLTRGGLWILRWPVNVDHIWKYEDNSGAAHLFTLQGNMVLELDLNRVSTPHQDNGVAFQSVVGSGAMVFDKGGVAMFSSYFTYFKFLFPVGIITANVYAITEDNPDEQLISTGQLDIAGSVSLADFGQMMYSDPSAGTPADPVPLSYSGDIGSIQVTTTSIDVIDIEVDEIVNQQSWEVVADTEGTDYLLSSATTTGYTIPQLYYGQ